MEKTTTTEITFAYPFVLNSTTTPIDAGTYRVTVNEEQIDGLSFSAFRKTGTHLEVPAIGKASATRQSLKISASELASALVRDKQRSDAAG